MDLRMMSFEKRKSVSGLGFRSSFQMRSNRGSDTSGILKVPSILIFVTAVVPAGKMRKKGRS